MCNWRSGAANSTRARAAGRSPRKKMPRPKRGRGRGFSTRSRVRDNVPGHLRQETSARFSPFVRAVDIVAACVFRHAEFTQPRLQVAIARRHGVIGWDEQDPLRSSSYGCSAITPYSQRAGLTTSVAMIMPRLASGMGSLAGSIIKCIEQARLRWHGRGNPAAARWCEPKFRDDAHHDLGLPIGDRNIGRLNRIA
jgi:hypothetical protein